MGRRKKNKHKSKPLPEPDSGLFTRRGDQWRLRLDVLTHTTPDVNDLRDQLTTEELKAHGSETKLENVPDDLLIAAASSGATTCMAFLDILDGDCFVRAPCLCCYYPHSAASARVAATTLRLFWRYYESESYLMSRAYVRVVAALSRDLHAEEVSEIKEHIARLDTTPDDLREVNNSLPGLCVTEPLCQPGVLWVYSTPEGRRLLRHLTRTIRKKYSANVVVTVASSDPVVLPRFRYRMYAARISPEGNTPSVLRDTALNWVRSKRRSRRSAK